VIIYRTFDGDNYHYYSKERTALDAADRFAEGELLGPNGFVRVEKLTLVKGLTANTLVTASLNGTELFLQDFITDIERIYERLAR
jgi:hypothetical protein